MVNTWQLDRGDVWIAKVTDERYYIHAVSNVTEVRGVPLIANVELRPVPLSDVVYDIEIPDQVLTSVELAARL